MRRPVVSRRAFLVGASGILATTYFVSEDSLPPGLRRWLEIPAAGLLLAIGIASYYGRRAALRVADEAASARAELAAYARGQAGVRSLGELALGGAPFDELLHAAAVLVSDHLGVSHSAVFELRPDRGDLVLRAGAGWDSGLLGRAAIGAGSSSHAGAALALCEPVVSVLGSNALFANPPLLRGHRIDRGLTVVIRGTDHPFGVLAAYSNSAHEFNDADAQFVRLVANLLTSVHRRRTAEEELRGSEERLRLALELTQMGTFDNDLVTGKGSWSEGLCQFLGIDPASNPGHERFTELLHPDDRARVEAQISMAIATGSDYEVEDCRLCLPDGQIRRFYARGTVLRDGSGTPTRLLGVALDVTERRLAQEQRTELEDQLRQAQKMEAVGQLAGGIAHDFNNLLLALRGYGELALRALARGEDAREEVEEMLRASDRAAALTKQLLAFSRRQVLQPQVVDLNCVVADIEKLLVRLIGEDVDIESVASAGPAFVHADRGQLEQVLTNLALNARDAMQDGGKLTIEVCAKAIDEHHPLAIGPGRYAVLAVSDTGDGMDAETASQIFEPFFTTKELGTGLGLSTVHGIVKQSGGRVWVYSEPGHGTTFKIYLPLVEETPHMDQLDEPAVRDGNGETILLVEDDAEVRSFVSRMLLDAGYNVFTASSGHQALLLARERPRIDLLVTDVVMPGASGRETAERLRELQPDTAVLYMSGYTDDVVLRRGVLQRDTAFLQKPFGSVDLARKVREVLDAR